MNRNPAAADGADRLRPPPHGRLPRGSSPYRKPTDVRTQEIVDAAARLFAERGYAETSMRNICARVGLTLGSLYYHVENKEAILVRIVTDTGEAFVEDMRRICESEARVPECAYGVGRRWMHEVHHFGDRWKVLMREQWRIRGPQYQGIFDLRRETETLLEDLLRRGIAEGSIRPHDVRLTSMAISGLMNSTLQWYRPGARLEADAIADHYVTLILSGITTGETPADPRLCGLVASAGNGKRQRRQHG